MRLIFKGKLTPAKATIAWFYGVKLTDKVNIPIPLKPKSTVKVKCRETDWEEEFNRWMAYFIWSTIKPFTKPI